MVMAIFKKAFPLFILGLFFSLFILIKPALADNEFSTSYDVTYQVLDNGITEVVERISLKNLTSKFYASNFTLSIGSTTITDVSAFDDKGPLQTKVDAADNKTSINVLLTEQVAGLNKIQTFTLKFNSSDFAQPIGKTWQVNLPKIPNSPNLDSYNLSLVVPVKFGEPTSIVPIPVSESEVADKLILNFNKNQLLTNGVSVNFGSDLVYRFTLNYNLDNSSLVPYITSITLPPDTNYQDILIEDINPAPMNVTVDPDGNYLAWYKVGRGEHQVVTVTGLSKLYITSKQKGVVRLSSDQINLWTGSQKYWEKDNPAIPNTLNEIFKDSPAQTTQEKARRIYRFVIDTLKYDSNKTSAPNIERLGAVTALNNPDQAVCMEFTDLFIALTRAAGIPARELDGFAYTNNTKLRPLSLSHDLLHAWPEYFDEQKGWIMVDPTWENTSGGVDYFTKFDLSHMVLAIKGSSSETPFTTDKVNVKVSDEQFNLNPKLVLKVDGPDSIWSGFPGALTVDVYNQGESVQPPTTLSLQTKYLKILGSPIIQLGQIPAFGFTEYKFNLRTSSLWQGFDDTATITDSDQTYTKSIQIKPFLLFQPLVGIIILAGIVIVGLYFSLLSLHIFHRRLATEKIKHPKK